MKSSGHRARRGRQVQAVWLPGILLWLLAFGAIAAAPHVLWTLAPAAGPSLAKSGAPGVYPIEFEPRALTEWAVGEPGELALPGGRIYPITASRVEVHASGNHSWIGKYAVNGWTYVAVLTYGPAGLLGEVRTPEGLMVLTVLAGEHSRPVLVDTSAAGWRMPQAGRSDSRTPPPTTTGTAPVAQLPEPKALDVQSTIDVLIGYTDGMVARAGSVAAVLARMDHLIAVSNQAYIDSQIAITLRLVHTVQVGYTDHNDNEVALSALTNAIDPVLAPMQGLLRDRYGADLVVLLRPLDYPAQVNCGVAWEAGGGGNGDFIGTRRELGFAVISDGNNVNGDSAFCSDVTFPHELGHNMGAAHDIGVVTGGGSVPPNPPDGAYPYSYGYVSNATYSTSLGVNVCTVHGDPNCFGTIMSFISSNGALRFSNPLQSDCPIGQPCGTADADNARALNNTRIGVSGWNPTKVPFNGVAAGTPQTTAFNSPFAQTLKVTIRDATNALVPGVTVNFLAPLSGASATLDAPSAVTDSNGVAQVSASANGIAGTYTVVGMATSGLVVSPFAFSLTNGAPTLAVTTNGNGTVAGDGINCPGTCTISPLSGTVVTLTAAAVGGSVFTGWLGSGCTGLGICIVTVNAANTVSATFAPAGTVASLDADLCSASTKYDALTDGLIIVRFMSGLTGTGLTTGVTGSGGTCRNSGALLAYLTNIAPKLDVDGNGTTDPLTDGMMILRYLFGLRGNAVSQGVIGAGATQTAAQIVANIAALEP